jgi:hypothetical protein
MLLIAFFTTGNFCGNKFYNVYTNFIYVELVTYSASEYMIEDASGTDLCKTCAILYWVECEEKLGVYYVILHRN